MQITNCQLNVLFKLKSFLGFNENKILIESFFYSHCNHFLLVWRFSNNKSLQKIKIIQNRAIQFFHNDYEASCKDLLDKSNKDTTAIQKLRAFFLEIFAVKQLLTLKLLNQTKWNLEVQVKEYQDQKFGIAYQLPLKTQKISLPANEW